jgi:hypothetical protein
MKVLILGLTLAFWNFDFFSDFHPTWPISSARSFASDDRSWWFQRLRPHPWVSPINKVIIISRKNTMTHTWFVYDILWYYGHFYFQGGLKLCFNVHFRGLLRFQGAPCVRPSSSQSPWRICCTERVRRGAMESAAFGGSWRKFHKNREGLALGLGGLGGLGGLCDVVAVWNSTWRTP